MTVLGKISSLVTCFSKSFRSKIHNFRIIYVFTDRINYMECKVTDFSKVITNDNAESSMSQS
jgi:hypothetical protein